MVPFEKANKISFDCNIQQVKIKEFDCLYYGCFFEDIILIFKINSDEILNDKTIFYSDHQHRGNIGEGQFHISNKNIKNHINKYFLNSLTYEKLFEIFNK